MESSLTHNPDVKVSETLGLWEPKRSLTLEAARRHSARIRVLRFTLIGLAILLVAALAWQFTTQQTSFIVDDNPGESVKMINPRYSGRTKDGLPYRLTSSSAIRLTQNAQEVALEGPVLSFMRTLNSEPSIVTAKTGRYNDVEQVLDLQTTVDLRTDDGYHCTSTSARVFAGDKRIDGDAPIMCDGSFGRVTGQSYEILNDYSEFVFKGGTEAYLTPKEKTTEAKLTSTASGETATSKQDIDKQDGDKKKAEKASSPTEFGFAGNQPISVKAETATYKSGLTVLNGNVDVTQGAARIESDEMYIYREVSKDDAGGSLRLGALSEIDARGNFRYTAPDNTVTGRRGVYDQKTGVMTVTGNVRATQPSGHVIKSDRLTYNVRNKTIRFGDQCVGENCGQSRTSLRFTPNQ